MPSARGAGREAAAIDHLHEGFHLAGTVDVDARHDVRFNSQVLCPSGILVTASRAPAQYEAIMPIALLALTAGAFGIGTTEFVIMGLLLQVSADLHVSIAAAGLLISGYALGRRGRRAAAHHRHPPRAAQDRAARADGDLHARQHRLRAGAQLRDADGRARHHLARARHLLRRRLGGRHRAWCAPERRASAIAIMFTGLTAATLLGVPAGAWLGLHFGWRSTFWAVALIGVVAFAVLAVFVPREPSADGRPAPLRDELAVLARPQVLLGPRDDGARLRRRVRGVHLHPAAADRASPASPKRRCRRSCCSSAAASRWATCSAASWPTARSMPRRAGHAGGAGAWCWARCSSAIAHAVTAVRLRRPARHRLLRHRRAAAAARAREGLGRRAEPRVQPQHRRLQSRQRARRLGRRRGRSSAVRASARWAGWPRCSRWRASRSRSGAARSTGASNAGCAPARA